MSVGAWGIFAGLWLATLTGFRRDAVWELLLYGMTFLLAAASFLRAGRVRAWTIAAGLTIPAVLAGGQLVLGHTLSPTATALDALRWLALAAWCVAAQRELSGKRGVFLEMAVYASGAMALVSIALKFWPWVNPNHFAIWCELMLPPALWLAVEKPRFWWAAAGLAAGGAASGSRAALGLMGLELLVLFFLLGRRRDLLPARRTLAAAALLFPLAAAWFGGEALWRKLNDSEPLLYRDQMWSSSLKLWREAPWFGHGAGTFEVAYPSAATFDTGERVDHAHNDWLEWGVEGGWCLLVPLLAGYLYALWLTPSLPWLLGVPIAGLHAAVDYPWARFSLCLWVTLLFTLASLPHPRAQLKRSSVKKHRMRQSPPKKGLPGPQGTPGVRIDLG